MILPNHYGFDVKSPRKEKKADALLLCMAGNASPTRKKSRAVYTTFARTRRALLRGRELCFRTGPDLTNSKAIAAGLNLLLRASFVAISMSTQAGAPISPISGELPTRSKLEVKELLCGEASALSKSRDTTYTNVAAWFGRYCRQKLLPKTRRERVTLLFCREALEYRLLDALLRH